MLEILICFSVFLSIHRTLDLHLYIFSNTSMNFYKHPYFCGSKSELCPPMNMLFLVPIAFSPNLWLFLRQPVVSKLFGLVTTGCH